MILTRLRLDSTVCLFHISEFATCSVSCFSPRSFQCNNTITARRYQNPEALMQNLQILSLFSVLLSLGLLMVIMGQYKEMDILQQSNEQLTNSKQMAYNKLQHEIDFKRLLQDLKTKGVHILKDLEAELAKLTTQLEGKTHEISTCQEQLVCFI
ncbi:hypothetical protein ILYODFUR_029804 [Ilyodon furcidens]|uniref:Uncharacterized protein n=1 Tax=Ilyodon furcidens TaxID=33524 RepID=A0ABV0SSI2_9TELE